MIKSRKIRRLGHVGRKGEKRHSYTVLVRKPMENSDVDEMMLKWILERTGWYGLNSSDSG
jgi:hypothetical protein